jgi:hypothetical protein
MMAQDNGSDLARLERMERRLQALEDAEAIRNLKARYAALCDDQYDAEGLRRCFDDLYALIEGVKTDQQPACAARVARQGSGLLVRARCVSRRRATRAR